MRFSTVFISSAFVLASLSVALPLERGNMLVTRFADSGFLAEVEARSYDEEPGHHRDHQTRIMYENVPLIPGTNNPPPNASLNGPLLHPHLRTYVSRNQVEARTYDKPEPYARARVPIGDHRDHDPRIFDDEDSFTPRPNPRPNQRIASTDGLHHRDYDTRILHEDYSLIPGTNTNPRPNQRTASTHGPSLHRSLRTYVSRNQVEARAYDEEPVHHRDHPTSTLYDDIPLTPGTPNSPPTRPDERTASTHGQRRLH